MRVLVCRCSIGYDGRITARLASGDRVLLFKDDGAVCVHGGRGFKPVNYMSGPTSVEEADDVIRVRRAASGETLTIVVEEVIADHRFDLRDAASLEREGSELELHRWLAGVPHLIEDGLVVVEREKPTDVGPIDLFCRDAGGRAVLVEVKRVRAVAAAIEQVVRYREQVERDPAHHGTRALVVAPEFAPQARALAATRDVELVVLDVSALRSEAEEQVLKLF